MITDAFNNDDGGGGSGNTDNGGLGGGMTRSMRIMHGNVVTDNGDNDYGASDVGADEDDDNNNHDDITTLSHQ